MKVLKFGGTSVGSIESLTNVKRIVESRNEQLIVVVSALGGLTDQLIATANKAAVDDPNYAVNCAQIEARHKAIIDALVPEKDRPTVHDRIDRDLCQLRSTYDAIRAARNLSQKMLDLVVSFGERMSSQIISFIIADATLLDSRNFIKTRQMFGKHVLETEETHYLIHENFKRVKTRVVVAPGFISTDSDGHVTNLGRGGSDYTAAILAAELGADALEIWTDVDGFMTADPRVIPQAKVIDELTFREAMELCNFGAKVIYPPTIYPVFNKDIPIVIKNTFNPDAPGTWISNASESPIEEKAKGVSTLRNTSLITLTGSGMTSNININTRIFNALAPYGVSVFFVSRAANSDATAVVVNNNEADTAKLVLTHEFGEEIYGGLIDDIIITRNLATIAVVGENMKHFDGIANGISHALTTNKIRVLAYAQGAGNTNVAVVVDKDNLTKGLATLHHLFFE